MIKRIRKTIDWLTKNYQEDNDEAKNMKEVTDCETQKFITPYKNRFEEASTRECFDTPSDFETSEAYPHSLPIQTP